MNRSKLGDIKGWPFEQNAHCRSDSRPKCRSLVHASNIHPSRSLRLQVLSANTSFTLIPLIVVPSDVLGLVTLLFPHMCSSRHVISCVARDLQAIQPTAPTIIPSNTLPNLTHIAAAPVKGWSGLGVSPGCTKPVEAGLVALPVGIMTWGKLMLSVGGTTEGTPVDVDCVGR